MGFAGRDAFTREDRGDGATFIKAAEGTDFDVMLARAWLQAKSRLRVVVGSTPF